jgi:hypothetical protein
MWYSWTFILSPFVFWFLLYTIHSFRSWQSELIRSKENKEKLYLGLYNNTVLCKYSWFHSWSYIMKFSKTCSSINLLTLLNRSWFKHYRSWFKPYYTLSIYLPTYLPTYLLPTHPPVLFVKGSKSESSFISRFFSFPEHQYCISWRRGRTRKMVLIWILLLVEFESHQVFVLFTEHLSIITGIKI